MSEGEMAVAGDVGGDVGGGGGDAASAPAVDTVAGGGQPSPGAAPSNGNAAPPKGPAEATGADGADDGVERYQVGEESLTLEELKARVSPDYEHAIKVKGQEVRIPNRDLRRRLELSEGALRSMQQSAETIKAIEAERQAWRENPDEAIEQHLDPRKYPRGARDYYMEKLATTFQEDERLRGLLESDPDQYRAAIEDRTRREVEDRLRREQARKEAELKKQQQEQQHQAFLQSIPRALDAAGLTVTPATYAHLDRIMSQYQDVGHELSVEDAAQMAAQAYRQEVTGYVSQLLAGKGPADVAKLLGEDVRKAIREYELEQVKGKPAPKPAPKPKSDDSPRAVGQKRRAASIAEVLRGIK